MEGLITGRAYKRNKENVSKQVTAVLIKMRF